MKLGYIGLGKMGTNMVLRLLDKGHKVIVWNRSTSPREEVSKFGAIAADSVEELVLKLPKPRVIWLMLPAGVVTGTMLGKLQDLLDPGDAVIDGANSFYKDTIKRAKKFRAKKIQLMDAGISGGPMGARIGACVMVGGDKKAFKKLEPLFADIAAHGAYQFFPGAGAGHFVKMVHNGIEYGMMQAIGEGFAVMRKSPLKLNLTDVARIYNRRSVIDSRLIDWLESAYRESGENLKNISGSVDHGGEGKWTVDTAKELGVEIPVIRNSLDFRINSQKKPNYIGKVVSALRNQFGGHNVKEK
jgi:6-phosphogluconate dehydrogenase